MDTPAAAHRPPRVYVTHVPMTKNRITGQLERTRDVTVAREHGELVYVFPGGAVEQEPGYLVRWAREKLADFTPRDFLLMSGDTAAMAVCAVVAAQRLGPRAPALQLLLWDRRDNRYHVLAPEVWAPASGAALVD